MSTTPAAETRAIAAAPRNPWPILIVVLAATFMQLLDVSIVGVAVASIQDSLHASYADVQLVLEGYQIGFAAILILAARLGDIFGRRRLFLIGMAGFTATSILCGLAPNIDTLLVARVVQGMSSALMFSQVLAIVQVLFTAKDRGAALGAYGTTIGLGTILGPVAGGLLIQANLVHDAWQPIFLVNVPIGVAAFTAALIVLPESTAPSRPRLDLPGALMSAVGLGLALYALADGRSHHWQAWVYVTLVAGIAELGVFVAYQRRRSLADRDPILDIRLFRDRAFRIGVLLIVLFYAGVPGFFLIFSLYLQSGEGFSALGAGLALFAYSIGAAITASNADAIAKKLGNQVLFLGVAGLILGMGVLVLTTVLVGVHPHVYDWIPAMAVSGLGFGLFVPTIIDIVLINVDQARAGVASGALATMQQVGGAVGVAIIGIIFFGLIGHNAPQAARSASPAIAVAAASSGVPAVAVPRLGSTFEHCFVTRAQATDPTVTPPGCADPERTSSTLATAYQRAARSATAHDFSKSFAEALAYQVLIYLLVFGLLFALPKVNPRQLADREEQVIGAVG